jgi:type 1 glutamine amidotransferase
MRRMLIALGCALLVVPTAKAAQEKKTYKLLYLTQSQGFKHGSVTRKDKSLSPSEESVVALGKSSGLFEAECVQDISVITPDRLKGVDALMFYTSGPKLVDDKTWSAIDAWLRSGKAFIGVHSATDTGASFPAYHAFINGTFDTHPWGAGETVAIRNHDPSHPAAKTLGDSFQIKDEIYQYKNDEPEAVRVLYSLDMEKCRTKRPYHVPIAWVRSWGRGRLFYTNLGHNESTWTNPMFTDHLLCGIRFALGLEDGPTDPNPALSYLEQARAFALVAGAEAGKDPAALVAKVEKAAQDVAWLKSLYGRIDDMRRKKGDAARLRDEIFAAIEAK